MAPLYPTAATGLLRNPKDSHTVSMAFFRTAGMLWLYSGVTTMKASACLTFLFQARTTGSEYVGSLMSPSVPGCSAEIGSGQSRRSATSTSNPSCARAREVTQGTTRSADRVGRVLPTITRTLDISALRIGKGSVLYITLTIIVMYCSVVSESAQAVAVAATTAAPVAALGCATGGAGAGPDVDAATGLVQLTTLVQAIYARVSERHDLTPV